MTCNTRSAAGTGPTSACTPRSCDVSPVPEPATRPADAVPAYLPRAQRVPPTGQLPLIERAGDHQPADSADPGIGFLTQIARALIAGAGHLVDPETAACRRTRSRPGWAGPRPTHPAGQRIGSLRPAGAAGVLMTLEPAAAVDGHDHGPSRASHADPPEPLTEHAVAQSRWQAPGSWTPH